MAKTYTKNISLRCLLYFSVLALTGACGNNHNDPNAQRSQSHPAEANVPEAGEPLTVRERELLQRFLKVISAALAKADAEEAERMNALAIRVKSWLEATEKEEVTAAETALEREQMDRQKRQGLPTGEILTFREWLQIQAEAEISSIEEIQNHPAGRRVPKAGEPLTVRERELLQRFLKVTPRVAGDVKSAGVAKEIRALNAQIEKWLNATRKEEIIAAETEIEREWVNAQKRYGRPTAGLLTFREWLQTKAEAEIAAAEARHSRNGKNQNNPAGTSVPKAGEPLTVRERELLQRFLKVVLVGLAEIDAAAAKGDTAATAAAKTLRALDVQIQKWLQATRKEEVTAAETEVEREWMDGPQKSQGLPTEEILTFREWLQTKAEAEIAAAEKNGGKPITIKRAIARPHVSL